MSQIPNNRVVDFGSGPRLFATKIISTRMERGGGAITLTLAVEDTRMSRLTDTPTIDNEVFAIVGTLTLTQPACADLVNSITGLLAGIQATKAKIPDAGAN